MSLLAPLLLAILHQRELGGTSVRQMDLDGFLEDHASAFVRAYAVDTVAAKATRVPRKTTRRPGVSAASLKSIGPTNRRRHTKSR